MEGSIENPVLESTVLLEQNDPIVPTSASSKVLNTTELLEHIMAYLPMNGITEARQVNRFFRIVVDTSKPLRRPMIRVFGHGKLLEHILSQNLSAAEVTRARRVCQFFGATIDSSRTLRKVMFLEPERLSETLTLEMFTNQLTVTKLHPFINRMGITELDLQHAETFAISPNFSPWKLATWRSMLVCQPPCDGFKVYYLETGSHVSEIREVKGNTLGALLEDVESRPTDTRLIGLCISGFILESHPMVAAERHRAAQMAARKRREDRRAAWQLARDANEAGRLRKEAERQLKQATREAKRQYREAEMKRMQHARETNRASRVCAKERRLARRLAARGDDMCGQ
ncbi:uncharacterized protein RCC_04434 [Ramularia collo-cygni]|uniref:Uncharacterized protein n=1 Tax=Ramularia collo-cygni TaxID=112498 RepID=A0A2D3UZE0_9PEZI|nr:uncharacterized protein RCC_04434 [Ramularia collo-cygni]CZT18590.1 uncharacterized protein RCC_04434 [Ramularia collo-cygni]